MSDTIKFIAYWFAISIPAFTISMVLSSFLDKHDIPVFFDKLLSFISCVFMVVGFPSLCAYHIVAKPRFKILLKDVSSDLKEIERSVGFWSDYKYDDRLMDLKFKLDAAIIKYQGH